jgi:predicted transcriptional regulator
MTNTLELEIAIKRAGLIKKEIANELGISLMGLYKKINNLTEFKASEIFKFAELLKIKDYQERERIFFAN